MSLKYVSHHHRGQSHLSAVCCPRACKEPLHLWTETDNPELVIVVNLFNEQLQVLKVSVF